MSSVTSEPSSTDPRTSITLGRPTRRARRAHEADVTTTDVSKSFRVFKTAVFAPRENDEDKSNDRFTNICVATVNLVRCFEGGLNTEKLEILRKAYRMATTHGRDFLDLFPISLVQEN